MPRPLSGSKTPLLVMISCSSYNLPNDIHYKHIESKKVALLFCPTDRCVPERKVSNVSSAVGQCVPWTMCPLAKGGHKLPFKDGDESVWVRLIGCGPPFDPITSMRSVQGLDTSVRDASIKGIFVQRTEHQNPFVWGRIRKDTSSHHPKKGL